MNQSNQGIESPGEILIIDDTPTNLQLLFEILSEGGHRVRTANNGRSGLETVAAKAPDLILLDIRMPAMDGFEVCRRLKAGEHSRKIPVIFVSAASEEVDKAGGFRAGAVDYVTKPFEAAEVLARVKTHLTIRTTQTRLEAANRQLLTARDELEGLNAELEDRVRQRTAQLEAANRALQESEERFREFVEGTDNLIARVDSRGRFLYVNHAARQVFGVLPEECIGFTGFSFIDERDRERTERWFTDCLRKRVASATIENRQVSRGGEKRDMIWTVNFHYDELGHVEHVNSIGRDITERKRLEKSLQEKEELLRKSQEIAHIGSWQLDLGADHLVWSDETYRIFGLVPQEFDATYGAFLAAVHPDDRALVDDAYSGSVRAGRELYEIEHRIIRKDTGEIRHVREECRHFRDASGRIVRSVGSVQDITERAREKMVLAAQVRLIEYAVKHTVLELLRKFLDEAELLTESEIGFYHFLEDDQQTLTLQAWSTNTEEKMCRAKVRERHYPLSEAGVWTDCIREQRPVIHNDYANLPHKKGLPEGHAKLIRDLVVPVFRGEKIVAILGVGNKETDYEPHDVRAVQRLADLAWETVVRRQAEEELRHLRNYLSNIIDSMPSVLVGVDALGKVTQWNRRAEQATGIEAEAALGSALADIFPRMLPEMEKIAESIRTRKVKEDRKKPRRSKSGTRYEDVTIYPLITNGVEGAVIRIDDVTDKVRMEEMMVQGEKMLSVGGLAAGMAHEINNPLAGMMQTANVMACRLGEDMNMPANLKAAEAAGTTMEVIRSFMEARGILRMLGTIHESGRRVADIVDNMLSFARKGEARTSSHDLSELLDKTLTLASTDYDLKKRYDFKMIRIKREYEANLPSVPCEGAKIQQVLLNILRNGAQAMEEAGTEKPRFIVRTRMGEGGNRVCMEIEDNGPGMDEATRKRVFEPFFTTKPVGAGTGLGLSVSYFIITENHGGEMAVESRPGSGAKFIIRLPLRGRKVQGLAMS